MDRAKTAVEIEIERHVLPQTKKLSDGTFEKIFTRNRRNESGIFTYNCHLCSVNCLPGERAVQTHITGRKHQQRLHYDYIPNAQQFRAPTSSKNKGFAVPRVFHASEPAPPGEEDADTMSHLETIGKHQNKALIGLEYVVELLDVNAKEPFYICTLCDKRCDPRNIMPQITSHRHRMKYMDYHFSTVMETLNKDRKFNMDMTYREEVLSKISTLIETKGGRGKPTICDFSNYDKNKEVIKDEIKRKKHFSEDDWTDSKESILESLKTMPEIKSDLDPVSTDEEYEDKVINDYYDSRAPDKVKHSRFSSVKKLLTPRELQEQSNNKLQETYVIEKYKAQVEIAIKELDKNFKEYEKSPEKHPLYSEEWKAFWSRRYKQLMAEGKDANGHDYKPEWIKFWTERMKELHKIDIDKKKDMFRKKLGLSIDSVSKIESSNPNLRERRRSRSASPKDSRRYGKTKSLKVVEISDESSDEFSRRSSEPRVKRHRSEFPKERSRSRFSEDSRGSEYHSKDAYSTKHYSNSSRDYQSRRSKSPEIIDDGPVNLISVCRLLAALEQELGLLAKTIIELLAKAVKAEKISPNSADDLLFNTENCNILETVKEKLKGVLTANLISPNKVIAVKRAVQNIATLLHENSLRKPTKSKMDIAKTDFLNSKEEPANDVDDPVALAKMQIAAAITESLLKEGRSNVSAAELEALVDSFMNAANDEEELEEEITASDVAEPKIEEKEEVTTAGVGGLENLTDEDLQTLLRNFADLNSDEQSHLIAYLSKIEQTNPTRVEKLRKYVNIGDGDDADFDDKDDDLDMDMATGVVTDSPKTLRKSPVKHELSDDDDDFNDELMAKKLGSQQIDVSKMQPGPSYGNALKDNLGLADSLMSSLMQSSTPQQPQNQWSMGMTNYYGQHHYMPQDINMYNQQLPMSSSMAMGMQMMPQQSEPPWPQNAASFFQDQPSNHQNSNPSNRNKNFLRKYENPNLQLTGKGRKNK